MYKRQSNNLDELSSSVSVESEVLKSYDYETDLDRPVIFENGPHRTSLSSLIESVTELSFAAFYRRNCTTVVAVSYTHLDVYKRQGFISFVPLITLNLCA